MKEENKENFEEKVLEVLKKIPDLKQWNINNQIKKDLEYRGQQKKELEKQRQKELDILTERRGLVPKRLKEVENFYEGFKIPCWKCSQLNKSYFGFFRGNVSVPMFILGFSECSRCKTYTKHKENDEGNFNTTITTFCLPININVEDLNSSTFTKYFSTIIDKYKREKLFKKIPPIKLHLE